MSIVEDPAVSRFREYIKIKTVQPKPDYDSAMKFLTHQSESIGLISRVVELVAGKPIMLMTWEGRDPTLPSILLNSHTDVVPVYEDMWKYDPFGAVKEDCGDIYGRGTQDMKSVGMQYLEAIRRLKDDGVKLERTIHLSFVPDEEISGRDGMEVFVKTEDFRNLNVGFILDEGITLSTEEMKVFYWERLGVRLKVTFHGNPGHASMFIQNTAVEKLSRFMNLALDYRDSERKRLEEDQRLTLGDVTTLNINIIQGGVQINVVPATITIQIDTRMCPRLNVEDYLDMVRGWCRQAGDGVTMEVMEPFNIQIPTSIDKEDPWFAAFMKGCEDMNLKIVPEIFLANTDSRFLRQLGLPALGFSPINNTPVLLHDHNEFINEKVFLRGIDIYMRIIENIANVPKF